MMCMLYMYSSTAGVYIHTYMYYVHMHFKGMSGINPLYPYPISYTRVLLVCTVLLVENKSEFSGHTVAFLLY
jgi:hypothetical protein